MNYLKQLLSFYDALELNPLNSSEIALWHALMSINNKSAWSTTFTVASSVLCTKAGLGTSNFFKTRNTLTQKGYIKWSSSGSNKAARYQIKVLYSSLSTHSVDTSEDSSIDTRIGTSVDTSRALNKHKQKETKPKQNHQGDDELYRNLITTIQQNFGINSTKPLMQDDLKYTLQDFTNQGTTYAEAIEIVTYAVKIAVTYSANTWSYVQGIIKRWINSSLFTMAEIKEYQEKPKQNKNGSGQDEHYNYDPIF